MQNLDIEVFETEECTSDAVTYELNGLRLKAIFLESVPSSKRNVSCNSATLEAVNSRVLGKDDATDQELAEQDIAYRFNQLNEIENEGFDLNSPKGVLDYIFFLCSDLPCDGVTATLIAKEAIEFSEAVKDLSLANRLELIKDYLDENEIVFPSRRQKELL